MVVHKGPLTNEPQRAFVYEYEILSVIQALFGHWAHSSVIVLPSLGTSLSSKKKKDMNEVGSMQSRHVRDRTPMLMHL